VNEETDPRAWGARVLAPLAFFTAATILVLIIHSSLTAESEGSTSPPAATNSEAKTDETATPPTTTGQGPARRRFYRIRDGDTLEAIALRFNTTVDDLLVLNPAIQPNALTPGRRIRVR
jgi:spore germination protein YaaH